MNTTFMIDNVPHKVQIRRDVDYITAHFNTLNKGGEDYGISKCVSIESFADLKDYLAKLKPDAPIKLDENKAYILCVCFAIIRKIVKSTYGELLFNEVLNKGHKKSSKKEFLFLSQDWINTNSFYSGQIFSSLPEVEQRFSLVVEQISDISL